MSSKRSLTFCFNDMVLEKLRNISFFVNEKFQCEMKCEMKSVDIFVTKKCVCTFQKVKVISLTFKTEPITNLFAVKHTKLYV